MASQNGLGVFITNEIAVSMVEGDSNMRRFRIFKPFLNQTFYNYLPCLPIEEARIGKDSIIIIKKPAVKWEEIEAGLIRIIKLAIDDSFLFTLMNLRYRDEMEFFELILFPPYFWH